MHAKPPLPHTNFRQLRKLQQNRGSCESDQTSFSPLSLATMPLSILLGSLLGLF